MTRQRLVRRRGEGSHGTGATKGLLWYDTYEVDYAAEYRVSNPDSEARELVVEFTFPSETGVYDDFTFSLNGADPEAAQKPGPTVSRRARLAPDEAAAVRIQYSSRGMDAWLYATPQTG